MTTMKKFTWMLLTVLALSSLAIAGGVASGAPAPDFTLKNSAGEDVSLSDFSGKYVVLEWVNYDCPFVKKHYGAGNMQKLQEKWTGKDVIWLAINSSAPGKQGAFSGEDLTKRMAKEGGQQTHYLLDPSGEVGKKYAAKTTPHMYVVDPAGKLIYQGAIDDKPSTDPTDIAGAKNYVKMALKAAKAGKTVDPAKTDPYGCSVKY